jgi:erythromycin esterase-like protein
MTLLRSIMRNRTTFASLASLASLASAITIAVAACHNAPPPPPPAPLPLSDTANAGLAWVQAHAQPFNALDSVPGADERARIYSLTNGARIIGFSELSEGSHEFPLALRRALIALADSGVRGLAVQASMADAMEIDRYVRGAPGDARRLLRTLGLWRYETREMIGLVETMRDWNRAHPDRTVGFYGFEIPTAAHAVATITTLPDSVLGTALKAFLVQRYSCVAMNEGAQWGREGRAQDSTFWSSCGPATVQAQDSVIALRQRSGARNASTLAFAEQMARLVAHHVSVGLRRLPRQEGNAEHVMFLANSLGANARLILVGGDVEMGRLTLDKTTVQTGVPLGQRLGAGYRNIAFAFGDGVIRARVPNPNARTAEPPGLSDAQIRPPTPGSYEDVLARAAPSAYWLDTRNPPSDLAGVWLKGPRPMRLVADFYTPLAPQQVETPIELPAFYDIVLFVKHATPARQ